MADKSVTALEITSTHIKLVQSQNTARGWTVSKLFVRDISSNVPGDISKALKELLSISKIKETSVILVVPRQFFTLRILKLPSQDNKEIEKMVELQIPKQIPWPSEDMVSGYSILEKDALGFSKVLLVICQKEIIKRYLKILSLASIKTERITLSSEGICRWYQDFSKRSVIKDNLPVVLLDIDTENTDVCFYQKENLLFTRSVSFRAADLAGGKLDALVEELHKTVSSLERDQTASSIGKIVIVTAAEGANLLTDRLKTEFSSEVSLVNPAKEILLSKDLIVPLAVTEGKCSAASILGVASGWLKKEFNLLPEEVKKEEQQKSKIRDFAILALVLVLLLIFSAASLAAKIYKKEQYLKEIELILKKESPKAKQIENSIKKLNLVKERLSSRGSSIDVIYELYNLIPDGVSLSIFSFDDADIITLQGMSLNMSDVFNFQSILEKSPYFKNVEVKYASKRKLRQTELTDFRITCAVDKKSIKNP